MPKIALAMATALVLLAACSGGDGSSGASASSSPSSSTEPTVATTTTEPTFTGANNQPFCDDDRAARTRLDQIAKAPQSPDSLKNQYTATADALRSLSGVAPEEIVGDLRILSRAYDGAVEGLTRVNWDPMQVLPVVSEKLGTAEVRTSSERLQVYERKVCGIA